MCGEHGKVLEITAFFKNYNVRCFANRIFPFWLTCVSIPLFVGLVKGSIPLAVPMLPVKRAKGIFWLFDKHHNTSAGNQARTYYYTQTDRFAQEQERQADGHDHTELVYRSHTRYISGLQCLEIKQPLQSRCYSRKDEEYPRMFA